MDPKILQILQMLVKAGIPLNQVLEAFPPGLLSGASSGLGLAGAISSGNVPGAIGGALGVGKNLAGLLDMPGVSNALGAVAGPLGIGTSLANGNPAGAIGAIPSTVAAGANLAGSAGMIGAETAAGIAGMASSVALPLMATLLAATSGDSEGLDLFDSLFGGAKTQAQKQIEEHKGYAEAWPDLTRRRIQGASSFGQESEDPEQALRDAVSGVRATDLSPAYSHLAQNPYIGDRSKNSAKIPGVDMSAWEQAAPILEGQNWGSFINLMDRGHESGMDINSLAGGSGYQTLGKDTGGLGEAHVDEMGLNTRTPLWDESLKGFSTMEADDLSNAIAGIGQQLGIDWGSRGTTGRNQGYEVGPDELAQYGFKQGNYGPAILSYLRGLDPSITEGANWDTYAKALGVTDDELMASQGAFRSKEPTPPMFNPYGFDSGGADSGGDGGY